MPFTPEEKREYNRKKYLEKQGLKTGLKVGLKRSEKVLNSDPISVSDPKIKTQISDPIQTRIESTDSESEIMEKIKRIAPSGGLPNPMDGIGGKNTAQNFRLGLGDAPESLGYNLKVMWLATKLEQHLQEEDYALDRKSRLREVVS